MKEGTLSPAVAARLLGISEDENRKKYARSDGRIPLEAVRDRAGAAALELARDLAHAREEVGRLSGQLKEVRAMNLRLQKEIKESVEERLMLMERIERIADIEQDLVKAEAELDRLRDRNILARLLNRR